MSKEIWESQLEINQIFDKRLGMIEEQLTLLTELTIELSQVSRKLAQPTTPTEPTGCTGKHCACKDGEM
jgi:hypothetical protein